MPLTTERKSSSDQLTFKTNSKINSLRRRLALGNFAWFKSSELISPRRLSLLIGVSVVVSLLTVTAHMQEPAAQPVVAPVVQIKQDLAMTAAEAPDVDRVALEPSGSDRSAAEDPSAKYPYSITTPANQTLTSMSAALTVPHAPLAGLTGLKNIPGDYATLALAVTDLNTNGVGAGGVTFNLIAANPQTAPAGGYVIGGAGSLVLTSSSAANPIIFTGNGNTITASGALTVGALNDGIFKLIGADFITITGFTLQENPANVVNTPTASNTMTEWGVALLYVSLTDGSQNNTIQGNTISLNRIYSNTTLIYSNTRHSATAVTTSAEVTAATGSNSNNKVYGNNVSNANYGIVFIGAGTTIAAIDTGNDIGGSSLATGNVISNTATGTASATGYVSLTGSNYSIFDNQQINDNVSFNTITTATPTNTTVTVGGILKNYSVASPTGTISTTINNNTVTVTSAPTTGANIGINNQGLTALSTATMSMSNNTVVNSAITGAAATTSSLTGITNLSAPGVMNMTGNTVKGCSSTATTTGGFQGISNSGAVVTTLNITNNDIGIDGTGAVTFTGASTGQIIGILNSGGAATTTVNLNNNNIRGIVPVASAQVTGVTNQAAGVGVAINIKDNKIGTATSNYVTYAAATSGVIVGAFNSAGAATATLTMTGNDLRGIVQNVTASGTHIYFQNQTFTGSTNISNNTITNITANTTGNVTMIGNSVVHAASTTHNVNNNSIVTAYNKTGAGGTILFYNAFGSSTNTVSETNTGNNFSNLTFPSGATIIGWRSADGTTPGSKKTITNNTFSNLTGGIYSSVLYVGFSDNTVATNNVSGNIISNVAGNGTVTGIFSDGQNQNFFGNTINTLSSNGAAAVVSGFSITGATTQNIFKNKIYDLSASDAAGTVNGILVSAGTTNNISNNLIADLRAPNATSALDSIRGINLTSTTTTSAINVYYNTIYLTAAAGGANFGTTGIFHAASATATTSALDLRNNIIINTSVQNGTGLAVAYRRSVGTAGTLANYAGTSNNNDFFAGTPGPSRLIYSDGTSTAQTLADYKNGIFTAGTIAPRDSASVTDNPAFVSTLGANAGFLHLNTATPTPVENAGAPIAGFTVDYDNDTRDAATPEIGADEVIDVKFSATLYAAPEGGTAILDVVRTGGAGGALDVSFTTSDGSAVGGATCTPGVDYIGNAGSLHFNAGVTLQQIGVLMCNDSVYEGATAENLTVTLSNPVGDGILGSPVTTTVNISEDEVQPTATIDNVTQNETNAGTTTFTFTVMLSGASSTATTINYNTSDVSATGGTDYVSAIAQSIVIPALQTSGSIPITVMGDTDVEPDETFNVTITSPDVLIGGGGVGVGTITNDDTATADYTVTTTVNSIVVSDVSGNSDVLTMSEPSDGEIKFSAPGRFFSVDGGAVINGDSGNLNYSGIAFLTINQNAGDDQLVITNFAHSIGELTINGGVGNDIVRFFTNATLAFQANRNLDLDLQNDDPTPGVDQIIFDAGSNLSFNGNGTATLKASQSIVLNAGSLLQVSNGDGIVEANQQAVATVGDFNGVDLVGGTVQTVGAGNMFIKGTGGAGDFIENVGVRLSAGGKVHANAAGTLDVQGTGGNGSGSATAGQGNLGVYVTGSGSRIDSNGAAIAVTGTGGTTTDNNVMGITLDELAVIETDGAGTLTITGNGGTVTGGGSTTFVNSGGVFITPGDVNGDAGLVKSTGTGANAGAIIINGLAGPGGNGAAQGVRVDTPGAVTTVDGPITINGTSGACGNACLGTSIRGNITASGLGAINITGTGAASTGAFPTHGVNVRSTGLVSTVTGDITITGTGGNGSDNAGFNLASAGTGTLQTTGTGNIIVIADIMKIGPSANATINVATNAVTLRPMTNDLAINLGSAADPTGGPLSLSDFELDRITAAGTINIGNANSGAITVSLAITRPAASNLVLTSGANIDLGSSLNSNGGNVTLLPATNNYPLGSGVDVTTSAAKTLTLAAFKNLTISISSTTVDSGYTQLNVAGLVNLNNAQLALSGTYVPVGGESFIIVNNDSNDPIFGTFNSLPEGATITNFLGSGLNAKITYVGGTGNDAVITVPVCPSAFTVNSNLDASDVAAGDGLCATAGAVCTLRAAIEEANATVSACGPININFSIPTSTITVASVLSMTHSVNINGPVVSSITVTGTAAVPTRVFQTVGNPFVGTTVNISNLTVSGGRAGVGAGLMALGPNSTTNLNGMLFTGNIAIDPAGFAGGGGAASGNGGTLNIHNTTFSGNTGTHGGAISVQGNSPLNLVNVTITNNLADGNTGSGPCPIGGSVDGDGGGIQGSTMPPFFLNIRNSIVAFNQDCNSNNPNLTGLIIDQGNNITFNDPSLNLGPLQNNGGPTLTYGLLAFSTAIDAGNDCVLTNVCVPPYGVAITTDQRGFPRPANGDTVPVAHVDIGAFEKQAPSAANSSITGHIVDSGGTPVEGVAIRLSGAQERLTVTDKEGNYRFEDVATNGFYTVTPSRANFSFTPGDRTFTQLGDHTDALFTATATGAGSNPLDTTEYFVRQQYVDFLNREPDEAGLGFWVNNINACGANAICRSAKRTDTSAAFFLSIEFHETGYLVYRAYQSAYGEIPGAPVPLNLAEFQPDTAMIGEDVIVNAPDWQAKLEANKQAYFAAFVARSRFISAYANALTPAEFVDRLFSNAGVTPTANDRAAVIAEFANAGNSSNPVARAHALRRVAENRELEQAKSNRAFVLMQYFGYLGRDPNALPDGNFSGYDFWLHKLEEFGGDFRRAEMVKAFLVAGEYRSRFPR